MAEAVKRREILQGAIAAAITASGVEAFTRPAGAAARSLPNYHVALIEQRTNMVVVYARYDDWGPGPSDDPDDGQSWRHKAVWSFKPGGADALPGQPWPGWYNISDIKFRYHLGHPDSHATRYGPVALVCAGGGGSSWGRSGSRAGIIRLGSAKHLSHLDLVWEADVGGNPHAIELLPDGGVVVASSQDDEGNDEGGFLAHYAPQVLGDPSSLTLVNKIPWPGARGALWIPAGRPEGQLEVISDRNIFGMGPVGNFGDYRIEPEGGVGLGWPDRSHGHDLMTDYHRQDRTHRRYLYSDNSGIAYRYKNGMSDHPGEDINSNLKVKSVGRHSGGEYIWVRAGFPASISDEWTGHTSNLVNFGATGVANERKGWSQARFYKARIFQQDPIGLL